MMKNEPISFSPLVDSIVKGMNALKAYDVTVVDLKGIEKAICDYFVICHGNTTTQTEAIARKVHETVEKDLGELPWHNEGFQNATWILLDYVDVVVHVFERDTRDFYAIEELWADAEQVRIEDSEKAFQDQRTSTN